MDFQKMYYPCESNYAFMNPFKNALTCPALVNLCMTSLSHSFCSTIVIILSYLNCHYFTVSILCHHVKVLYLMIPHF